MRARPDLVWGWSDDEITLRRWRLFPRRRNEDQSPAEPTEMELAVIRNDASGLLEKRKRLADISWRMRRLVEPIARRRNKEDEVTGRYWEGRFKAQPPLDETTIAACRAYGDLNPIRTKVASTLEESDFTSAHARIADRQSAVEVTTAEARNTRTEHGEQAGADCIRATRKQVREKTTGRSASNKGGLPMTLDTYPTLQAFA